MSITKALSNAMSGLTATARGTETVAANLANAMTPSYARREVMLSAQTLGGAFGGVRVDGVMRIVNASVLSEQRTAEALRAEADTMLAFHKAMQASIGIAGGSGSLGDALTSFQTALSSAASRPDDEVRLTQLGDAAAGLAARLNSASAAVQKARGDADQAIAADVGALNAGLEQVSYLNRRIAALHAEGSDVSSLMDARQAVVDKISKIVPVQEVAREAGKIALFTTSGAPLLDGTQPISFQFDAAVGVTWDSDVASGTLSRLAQNGADMTPSQMQLFAGGTLSAYFAIRDNAAPAVQQELDALAFELHQRLGSGVDTTIGATDAALFTDAGLYATTANIAGLSSRIALNAAVQPSSGGDIWRLRAGVGATSPGAVGESGLLVAMANALTTVGGPAVGTGFTGNGALSDRFGVVESRIATRRVTAEQDAASQNSFADTISLRLAADGVDRDAETSRLLEYEQIYAANARVIQAVQDMMDQILRL